MSEAVVRFARVRVTDAWHTLGKEAQDALIAQVQACLDTAGGKRIVICDARWASEDWLAFMVEEFPTVDALQAHTSRLNDLGWYRYAQAETMLGTHFVG